LPGYFLGFLATMSLSAAYDVTQQELASQPTVLPLPNLQSMKRKSMKNRFCHASISSTGVPVKVLKGLSPKTEMD
jgi:hypothetical protein